ncbi:MAG: DUF3619 family protein [Burkholderiales bacterium]|nr:DUF3619 family protein [Burkholderiales bacterium]
MNAAQREALEARFALRLSARLEAGSQGLPHDITERLRVARAQSVALARAAKAQATSPVQIAQPALGWQLAGAQGGAGSGTLSGWTRAIARATGHGRRMDDAPLGWGWRLASALPMIALVAGLWGIHTWYRHEQLQAATDVDMALLTDDLPPSAYSDPGFEEYLHSSDGGADTAAPATAPESDNSSAADHGTT